MGAIFKQKPYSLIGMMKNGQTHPDQAFYFRPKKVLRLTGSAENEILEKSTVKTMQEVFLQDCGTWSRATANQRYKVAVPEVKVAVPVPEVAVPDVAEVAVPEVEVAVPEVEVAVPVPEVTNKRVLESEKRVLEHEKRVREHEKLEHENRVLEHENRVREHVKREKRGHDRLGHDSREFSSWHGKVRFPHGMIGGVIKVTLTRAKFEELCSDLLDRLKQPVDNALRDAKLSLNDIDAVILVGGLTSILSVHDLGRKLTGKLTVNPDEVVALGAVVQADKMVKKVEKFVEEEENRDPMDTESRSECQTEKLLKELEDEVPATDGS